MNIAVTQKRNYGIDLLRMVAMFMVVILHLLGWGGLLESTPVGSANYWCGWALETLAYCAVDCFALISGFVMWKSKFKTSKIFQLWLQVTFYTIVITLIFALVKPKVVGLKQIVKMFLPISSKQYWYISAYFFLFLTIPILNIAIDQLPRRTLRNVVLGTILMTSTFPLIMKTDPYGLTNGYSAIWLIVLYVLGGYLSKYEIHKWFKKTTGLLLFFLSATLAFLSKVLIVYISGKTKTGLVFINYTSPLIILCAVGLLFFMANLQIGPKMEKLIKIFAPAALGVYIIHNHPLVSGNILRGSMKFLVDCHPGLMILVVVVTALSIYFGCSILELGRQGLFRIITKIFKTKK